MDTTTIDITNGKTINVTPMTPEEARECTEAIKRDLESLRLKLLEMERRRGWDALGYSSWREWATAEIGKSERRVYEILEAAKVEENLTFCGIPQNEIPTTISQLNELAKLPQEQQPEALQKAQEIAQAEGKKRNAAHVAQAVQELKPSKKQKETKTQPTVADSVTSTGQPKTGWDISPQSLTTTVSSLRIMVHFEDRGDEYFFEFCGPEDSISESGFHSELISDRAIVRREYLNPGVWADFRSEELYKVHQKSLQTTKALSQWVEEIRNEYALKKQYDPERIQVLPIATEPKNLADWEKWDEQVVCPIDGQGYSIWFKVFAIDVEATEVEEIDEYTPDHEKDTQTDLSQGSNITDTADADTQLESVMVSTSATPSLTQASVQTLSAAVESCLGEFLMPESLNEPLRGKLYISPQQAVGQWVRQLLRAYKSGEVTEAIALLPLDYQTFNKFNDCALCPVSGNLVAVYLGKRVDNFVLCFEELGSVWHRYV
jgi:hypothetical protein